MNNGPMLKQGRKRGEWGLWATRSVAADRAEGRSRRVHVGKLSFRFLSFKLGKFVSSFSSYNLAISARKVRVRL